ncbi:hypothetical protein CYMTET_52652 [Cymbomonas tetramitiformis]|uniref:Uncharacterized protein n=1 Tax=Cymbomonas tetramitiformis TaxID=36881 RepID=A0AAE0ERF2_9CHLO|nr:hypothetical protein CYMTET_52652 [Cymbomonas tetramitiformis]
MSLPLCVHICAHHELVTQEFTSQNSPSFRPKVHEHRSGHDHLSYLRDASALEDASVVPVYPSPCLLCGANEATGTWHGVVFNRGRGPCLLLVHGASGVRSKHLVMAARSNGEYTSDEWDAALQEAREILQEATEAATDEARAELVAAFETDAMGARDAPEGGDARDQSKPLVLVLVELQNFLQQVGLKDFQSERLARDLVASNSPYQSVRFLDWKFKLLGRTLPDVDVARLILKDNKVLEVDIGFAVERLLRLYELFQDLGVPALLEECPRILYCEDFEERLEATLVSVRYLCPKLNPSWEIGVIHEEPTLLFTLPEKKVNSYTDISELPIDIQNCISWATRAKYNT